MTYQPDEPEGLIHMTISLTVPCTRCGNPAPRHESIEVDPLCRACTRLLAEAEWLTSYSVLALRECPGYGTGEDCGGPAIDGSDLCADCHGARCDVESPRIPR